MQVHPTTLDSVLRFLGTEGQRSVEAYEERFQKLLRLASRFRPLEAGTRLLEVGIGMGYVPAGQALLGTELTIDVRGRPRRARVVKKPIYKPGSQESAEHFPGPKRED